MDNDLVSVIIPVFNGEKYLQESIDSVIAQEGVPIELIVVDDGSTDGSKEIVSSYRDKFPIRYFYQNNQGLAASRNQGITLASGDFIAFNDADDTWAAGKLAAQMEIMLKDPSIEMVSGKIKQFISPEIAPEEHANYHFQEGERQSNSMAVSLFRKEVFFKYGLFDPQYRVGQDMNWVLQAKDKGLKIVPLPELVLHRRLHPGNWGRIHQAENYRTRLQILKRAIDGRKRSGE